MRERLRAGGTTAITAIHGIGGIGKTTLARKLAHEVFYTDKLFRAALWADIGRAPDPLVLLTGWARFADPTFGAVDTPLDMLALQVKALLEKTVAEACTECEGGRVLVVLDDVWPQSLKVAELLRRACPEPATVLITTRSREVAVRLGAQRLPLDTLSAEEGAQLLAQLLPATDPADRLALSSTLSGHALALTIAAKRVQLKASRSERATLKAHLAEYQKGLPVGQFASLTLGEGESREDNLALALSFSYDDLDKAEQARFRALGTIVYDTPFDLALLQALWQAASPDQAEDWADRLILASLLEVSHESNVQSPESGNESDQTTPPTLDSGLATLDSTRNSQLATRNFFRLHPLLHAYAVSLLAKEGEGSGAEMAEVRRRYEEHAITLAAPFRKLPPQEWKQLAPDIPHIHAVGDGLVAQTRPFFAGGEYEEQVETEWEEGLARRASNFAYNITRYLYRRREVRKREWLEMGLAAARRLYDQQREGLFLNNLGLFCQAAGQMTQALNYYEQDLSISRKLGDRAGEATTLSNIGVVYDVLGQKDKALQYYEQALTICREVGDRSGEATTLVSIGYTYRSLGQPEKALQYYEQALPIQEEVDDRGGEATTFNNIGAVYDDLDQKDKALEYYAQALSIRRAVGDRGGEATTFNNIGSVYFNLGQPEKALEYYERALPIRGAVGDRGGEATTLNNIGLVYDALGQKDKALQYFEQALPIQQEVGDRYSEAIVCSNISFIHKAMGRVAEAEVWLARCVEIMKQVQYPDLEEYHAILEQWRAELSNH